MVLRAARLGPTLEEERGYWRAGWRWVAGMDEVGRGAWAGPVSVGVALCRPPALPGSPGSAVPGSDPEVLPEGLDDSKRLSEDRRERIFGPVAAWCAAWAVGHASPQECDQLGMRGALGLAAHRALGALGSVPGVVLLDGPTDFVSAAHPGGPGGSLVVPVVGGDRRCATIAAASIVAKVARDRLMRSTALHFPAYDFERNKGYPSPQHRRALAGYGVSAIHRVSWSYVEDLPFGPGRAAQRPEAQPAAGAAGSLGSPRTLSPTMLRRISSDPPATRRPGTPSTYSAQA